MSRWTFAEVDDADVPTPPAGKMAMYFSTTLGGPAYKDDLGVVHSLIGATGVGKPGPIGPIGEEADYEPILIPGRRGPVGPAGATGATGAAGQRRTIIVQQEDAEDGLAGFPGRRGADGVGSGGTILYAKWDSLVPDSSPHAATEEFNTSDLSAFTIVNSRGTVDADTTAPKKLFFGLPSQQYRFVCALKALPADAALSIHTIVNHEGFPASGLLNGAGIILSSTNTTNSGAQRLYSIGHEAGAIERQIIDWLNFGETAGGAATPLRLARGGTRSHIHLSLSGGVWTAGWSSDGLAWWFVNSTPGFTVNYFGLAAHNYSGQDSESSFEFMRYYSAVTRKTGDLVNVLG